MAEYIKREELLELYRTDDPVLNKNGHVPLPVIRQNIMDIQAADVAPVRCRECNQGEIDDPDFPDQYYCHAGCGWNEGNFYCAYGERKEGAEC